MGSRYVLRSRLGKLWFELFVQIEEIGNAHLDVPEKGRVNYPQVLLPTPLRLGEDNIKEIKSYNIPSVSLFPRNVLGDVRWGNFSLAVHHLGYRE
jgi:hypothetical protein